MTSRGLTMGLLMALVALLCARTMAQSGTSGCTNVIVSLAPCLNYVSGTSSTPSSSCCTQLASVVKSQPACLCSVLNGGASSLGVTINQTLALALPAACNVQTPPVSDCNAVDAPVGSPQGSKTTPSTGGSSAGNNIKSSLQLVLFFLLAASYVVTSGKL
ncbi:hypothetical protein SLEP1_g29860 [Rubroshorea leprosula]|uniref:Bifunctional inhibitor/plant lipid transfer protein/seed storage helical domain-containing protein n=1 Tax=Rubroshorea leprosula TaxID=152421 RepID=A0AAV5JYA4_9ROSI|nr:hypothetical protein SLEP1_g29860 [Rubroshorea leprosula]